MHGASCFLVRWWNKKSAPSPAGRCALRCRFRRCGALAPIYLAPMWGALWRLVDAEPKLFSQSHRERGVSFSHHVFYATPDSSQLFILHGRQISSPYGVSSTAIRAGDNKLSCDAGEKIPSRDKSRPTVKAMAVFGLDFHGFLLFLALPGVDVVGSCLSPSVPQRLMAGGRCRRGRS